MARSHLLRTVGLIGAVGISIAGMSPTLAMNLNPQQLASHVGTAVPLVFALATAAVVLTAWCFARLSSRHPHAGSVYHSAGATLGPRTGLFAGWSLFGAYLSFGGVFIAGIAIFLSSLVPALPQDAVAVVAAVVIVILSIAPVRTVTVALLVVEAVSLVSMTILAIVVFSRADFQHAGVGGIDLFIPASGIGFTPVALALAFGLLSFAGFEQVATLGEDTMDPRRQIPIALIGTAAVGGAIYTLVAAAEVLGVYDKRGGMDAFLASDGLLQTLGTDYVSPTVGDAFELFAVASALAGALAVVVATTRMLFAFARDLAPASQLARVSDEGGAPRRAIVLVSTLGLAEYGLCRVAFGATPQDVFFWFGTLGAIMILVPYLLVAVGAGRSFAGNAGLGKVEVLVPLAAGAVILYTLKASIYPLGEGAYAVIPFVALGWLALGVLAPIVRPGLLERVRTGLLAAD